jgi:AraC family transcriptional regulator
VTECRARTYGEGGLMQQRVSASRAQRGSWSGASRALQVPGESRRVLGTVDTPSMRAEETVYAAGLCVARHFHDTSNLVYTVAGAHWSGLSREGGISEARSLRFLPAGELHENYFPVEARCLQIELRRPIWDVAAEHGSAVSAPSQIARPVATALGARLYREFRQNDDVSRLGMEAAILQLVLAAGRETAPRRGPIPGWLLRIREMLRDEETVRLTLAELSVVAGRHPVQVSRQFRHHFGCTISEYVRRMRIARAQLMLARDDIEIAQVAIACGFADQSHFTAAFRKVTGVPPRRYRVQMADHRAAKVSPGIGRPK